MRSEILKRAVEAAHAQEAEEIEKRAGRKRGVFAVSQRPMWGRGPLGMIPGGTRSAAKRTRNEITGELVAGLPTRALIGSSLLGAMTGSPLLGALGAGAGAGVSLTRLNRLSRAAGYLGRRSKRSKA